ncbi:MAG: DUF4386 domain-containing protein [bacterium]|nr:DUF4386 domain-containing protein [bacterium]
MRIEEQAKSINKTARAAGILYLVMAPFAVFGMKYMSSLVVPGDAAATAANIMASELLVRLSVVSALAVQVGHVFLVLLLYKLLKPVNETHALHMVMFMLVGVPITMLSELNHLAVLLLLNGADHLIAEPTQLHALVLLLLDLRADGVAIAMVFWGLWLFPMGYLVYKSGYIPRVLGVLLMLGCIGYVTDFFTFLVLPEFETPIGGIMGIGELALPLWLLIRGVDVEQWKERALESA